MGSKKAQMIVALDVESLGDVRTLVEELDEVVDIYKIGSQLFTACGPGAVRFIMARGKKVFLDLKYHDIPNTVASAVRSAIHLSDAVGRTLPSSEKVKYENEGLFMYTMHTVGGMEMMRMAVEEGTKQAEKNEVRIPLAVGVTVLTSEEKSDNISNLVLERAALAKKSGLHGVVASVHETKILREKFGKDFIIVTPGIRPEGSDVGDQKRVATPKEAIQNGSNYLVVGRPIVKASNPYLAAKNILKEIDQA